MPNLSRELRRSFETTIKAARVTAEAGAADALRRLGVAAAELPAHLEARRAERNRLRAHARSLGDRLLRDGSHEIRWLTEAAAYVQWHRLLFTRFLLERGLLRDEAGILISLADCREEAAMEGRGDEWSIAATHAARLLPGVFPPDDPVESLTLAPEHAKALRDHLRGLDAAIFAADYSLGWTYQFWRAAEKKAVNESQEKIGAAELPAVTQLFTEPYMVKFLLHNTLGAWWAGKVLAAKPELARDAPDEDALRAACALSGVEWDYLRFVREDDSKGIWRPAAGTFPDWPSRAAEITYLDPCCGSGHFLVEAFAILVAVRRAEEGLPVEETARAVLRDNLHGLEIDGRCVQIAAFNVALAAWRLAGGPVQLPVPHIAWVGALPPLPRAEFIALANGDAELQHGLAAMHDLFRRAPLLGSLIELSGGDLVDPTRIGHLDQSTAALVEKMRGAEPERAEGALAARGMADAAAILAQHFTLIATNVPFLGAAKQVSELKNHIEGRYPSGRQDLYAGFLIRLFQFLEIGGSSAVVTPQTWYFLASFEELRRHILENHELILLADIGPAAFQDMNFWAARTALTIFLNNRPSRNSTASAIDASKHKLPELKADQLRLAPITTIPNADQLTNPKAVITTAAVGRGIMLSAYSWIAEGLSSGDNARYRMRFWEVPQYSQTFELMQGSPDGAAPASGCQWILRWEQGRGPLSTDPAARVQGQKAWGERGFLVSAMRGLAVSLQTGEIHEKTTAALVPNAEHLRDAIWTFVTSRQYKETLRLTYKKVAVATSTMLAVPFDLAHWRRVAAEKYPNGLPEPYSDDPTQWLFHGHPRYAEPGTELHVALVRLGGYRWPAESDTEMRLSAEARTRVAEAATLPTVDADGLLALVPVLGERPLADRLRAFCVAAWGDAWQPGTEAALIASACERAKDKPPKQLALDAWLRTHAARQHAKLFHERPFLWWITDGRSDGFTAVAHYHRLTRANLERLAYTVLGDWITRLGDDPRAEAARVLQAKLAGILEGEAPYDIFVRWKPLARQPVGWEPDLDDGVRLNIRPFIEAGVLAYEPNLKYGVDRGKDMGSAPWYAAFGGERRNSHHTTLAEKRAARDTIATAAK